MGFQTLVRAVDVVRGERGRAVVAISGFGGSGKSTLAERLRLHYGVGSRQVVRVDDFIVDRGRGDGLLGGFDWARLQTVLADVRAGRPLRYRANDFEGRAREEIAEDLPAVVIVEGIRLLRPELDRYFDLRVWIDCPLEVAAARGRRRDEHDGAGAAHLAIWEAEWVPKDRAYFEACRPDLLADLTYRT